MMKLYTLLDIAFPSPKEIFIICNHCVWSFYDFTIFLAALIASKTFVFILRKNHLLFLSAHDKVYIFAYRFTSFMFNLGKLMHSMSEAATFSNSKKSLNEIQQHIIVKNEERRKNKSILNLFLFAELPELLCSTMYSEQ